MFSKPILHIKQFYFFVSNISYDKQFLSKFKRAHIPNFKLSYPLQEVHAPVEGLYFWQKEFTGVH